MTHVSEMRRALIHGGGALGPAGCVGIRCLRPGEPPLDPPLAPPRTPWPEASCPEGSFPEGQNCVRCAAAEPLREVCRSSLLAVGAGAPSSSVGLRSPRGTVAVFWPWGSRAAPGGLSQQSSAAAISEKDRVVSDLLRYLLVLLQRDLTSLRFGCTTAKVNVGKAGDILEAVGGFLRPWNKRAEVVSQRLCTEYGLGTAAVADTLRSLQNFVSHASFAFAIADGDRDLYAAFLATVLDESRSGTTSRLRDQRCIVCDARSAIYGAASDHPAASASARSPSESRPAGGADAAASPSWSEFDRGTGGVAALSSGSDSDHPPSVPPQRQGPPRARSPSVPPQPRIPAAGGADAARSSVSATAHLSASAAGPSWSEFERGTGGVATPSSGSDSDHPPSVPPQRQGPPRARSPSEPTQPRKPELVSDLRFQLKRSRRLVLCNQCYELFQGSGVGAFAPSARKAPASERMRLWMAGQVDASWYCVECWAEYTGRTVDRIPEYLGWTDRDTKRREHQLAKLRRPRCVGQDDERFTNPDKGTRLVFCDAPRCLKRCRGIDSGHFVSRELPPVPQRRRLWAEGALDMRFFLQ